MSYTRLRYHIVTGTSSRQPLITPDLEPMLYRLLCDAAHQAGGAIVRVGGTATHVHMVAAIPPTLSVGSFVQQVKSVSSRITNRSDVTAKPFAWQTGYGAFTANPHDLDTLVRYVDRQKQHHRVGTTQRHLERTS